MAQTNYGGNKPAGKLNVGEIRAKVVAFRNQITQIQSPEILKGYLNFLCPTIEEKVAFISMFDKTYPQDREIQQILSMWLDEEFTRHCNQQVVKGEINKLKGIYQAVYGEGLQEQKTLQDEKENFVQREEPPQQTQKKTGVMSKLFGGFFGKNRSAKVSKPSSEELSAARGQILVTKATIPNDYDAEYRLQKYNQRVAARAEMTRLSPAYEKDISVMSR